MYLMSTSKGRARRGTAGEIVMEYGKAWKAVPIVAGVVWTILLVLLTLDSPPKTGDLPAIAGILAIIVVTLLPTTMELYGVSHRITSNGIQKHTPWSRDLTLRWNEVRSVSYNIGMNWYVVEGAAGSVRISRYIDGLNDFAEAIRTNLPAMKWSQAERYFPKPRIGKA